jgi:hypothetical protein
MVKGRGEKAERKRLAGQGFTIWRESRVTLATAISQNGQTKDLEN